MTTLHDQIKPERDSFEAWLNPMFHAGNVSEWVYPGRYEKETHQLAWLAWKERAELAIASDARIASLEAALRLVSGCAYPVSTEINSRGYAWSEAYLDQVKPIIEKLLKGQS